MTALSRKIWTLRLLALAHGFRTIGAWALLAGAVVGFWCRSWLMGLGIAYLVLSFYVSLSCTLGTVAVVELQLTPDSDQKVVKRAVVKELWTWGGMVALGWTAIGAGLNSLTSAGRGNPLGILAYGFYSGIWVFVGSRAMKGLANDVLAPRTDAPSEEVATPSVSPDQGAPKE